MHILFRQWKILFAVLGNVSQFGRNQGFDWKKMKISRSFNSLRVYYYFSLKFCTCVFQIDAHKVFTWFVLFCRYKYKTKNLLSRNMEIRLFHIFLNTYHTFLDIGKENTCAKFQIKTNPTLVEFLESSIFWNKLPGFC